MPEGDTLYRLAARLRPHLVGEALTFVDFPTKSLDADRLRGRTVTAVESRGKNLLVQLDDGSALHVHLRMTGRVRVVPLWDKRGAHTASFVLETARARIVGSAIPVVRILTASALRRDERLRALGPDPLGERFDEGEAVVRLRRLGDVAIGEALLDQRAFAGIGNVYKSELLFRAKLDPFTTVRAIDDVTLLALVRDAAALLRWNGARARGRITRRPEDGARSPTGQSVYGRTGRTCFDCEDTIRSSPQAGRTTYFCPTCQAVRAPNAPRSARRSTPRAR